MIEVDFMIESTFLDWMLNPKHSLIKRINTLKV